MQMHASVVRLLAAALLLVAAVPCAGGSVVPGITAEHLDMVQAFSDGLVGFLTRGERGSRAYVGAGASPVISAACEKVLSHYETEDKAGRNELLDALGKPGSGILNGNTRYLGDFEECAEIPDTEYCTATLHFVVPGAAPFSFGVCTPNECVEDLAVLIAAEAELGCQHRPKTFSKGATAVLSMVIVLAALNLLATAVDLIKPLLAANREPTAALIRKAINNDEDPEGTGNGEEAALIKSSGKRSATKRKEGFLLGLLASFSVYRNLPKLCKTEQAKGTLTCLNGIRTLSMMWVVLGHVYFFGLTGFYFDNTKAGLKVVGNFTFAVIDNGWLSVDSFFFLSGLLVTYGVLSKFGAKGRLPKLIVPMGYMHRFLRLTPVLVFVLLVNWQLLSYFTAGPMWQPTSATSHPCDKYWWSTVLYIQNFYPVEIPDQCLGWSWYLANDFQMFLVGLPLSVLVAYRPKVGLAVTALVSVGCMVLSFALTYKYKLRADMFSAVREGGHKTSQIAYQKPWFRIQPYLVGIVTAYALLNVKRRISQSTAFLLHIVAAGLAVAAFYAFNFTSDWHLFFASEFTQLEDALYLTFGRFAWAVALAWLVFACVKGLIPPVDFLLSMPVWAVTSKLTYTAYLIHPVVINSFYLTRGALVHYDMFNTIVNYFGLCTIVYCAAFLISLCVEFPFAQVEKKLLRL